MCHFPTLRRRAGWPSALEEHLHEYQLSVNREAKPGEADAAEELIKIIQSCLT
jgi:hypothetical protein